MRSASGRALNDTVTPSPNPPPALVTALPSPASSPPLPPPSAIPLARSPPHPPPVPPPLAAVVYVTAEPGTSVESVTHTAASPYELPRMDSARRNAFVSTPSARSETPAFARNRCQKPHSDLPVDNDATMRARYMIECGITATAADGLAIVSRGATRDTGAGVLGNLDGSPRLRARKPASCRAPSFITTMFTSTTVARRRPWSGSHTPDAGKDTRHDAGAAGGRGARAGTQGEAVGCVVCRGARAGADGPGGNVATAAAAGAAGAQDAGQNEEHEVPNLTHDCWPCPSRSAARGAAVS